MDDNLASQQIDQMLAGSPKEPGWVDFGVHIHEAGLTIHQEFVAALVKGGFNVGRWPILLHLRRSAAAVRQTDLAKALGADRLTLGAILRDAEQAGFITRDYDVNDRRIKLVGLTEAGRRRADEVNGVIEEICARFSDRVTPEEAEICVRVLRQVCGAIKD